VQVAFSFSRHFPLLFFVGALGKMEIGPNGDWVASSADLVAAVVVADAARKHTRKRKRQPRPREYAVGDVREKKRADFQGGSCCKKSCLHQFSDEQTLRLWNDTATATTKNTFRRGFCGHRLADRTFRIDSPRVLSDIDRPLRLIPVANQTVLVCKKYLQFALRVSNSFIYGAASSGAQVQPKLKRVKLAHKRVEVVRFLVGLSQWHTHNPDSNTISLPFEDK
jgi:hypothetical protein